VKTTWIGKAEVRELLQVSERTLARYRSDHLMIGIHYTKLSEQKILYNRELILDWLANKHDWITHLRAIELYQASLPSNQKRRKTS
jgi:hypothetical protein